MPAKKPVDLVVMHLTKAERQQREEQEGALAPKKALTARVPAKLTGEIERSVWQETVRQYLSLEDRIVSVLDRGILLDYCAACQQLVEIDGLRSEAMNNYTKNEIALTKVLHSKKDIGPRDLLKLINAVNKGLDEVIKLDARADNKRRVIHTFRQALMLTPRSRAGVNPKEKEREQPQSEMAMIIDGEPKKKTRKTR